MSSDRELLVRIAEESPWDATTEVNVCRFCDRAWMHSPDCLWLEIVRHVGRADRLEGERVYFPDDFYHHGAPATLDGIMDPALCTCPKQRGYGHQTGCPFHLPWARPWR